MNTVLMIYNQYRDEITSSTHQQYISLAQILVTASELNKPTSAYDKLIRPQEAISTALT